MEHAHRGETGRARPGGGIESGNDEVRDENAWLEGFELGQQPEKLLLDGFPVGKGHEADALGSKRRKQGIIVWNPMRMGIEDERKHPDLEATHRDKRAPAP